MLWTSNRRKLLRITHSLFLLLFAWWFDGLFSLDYLFCLGFCFVRIFERRKIHGHFGNWHLWLPWKKRQSGERDIWKGKRDIRRGIYERELELRLENFQEILLNKIFFSASVCVVLHKKHAGVLFSSKGTERGQGNATTLLDDLQYSIYIWVLYSIPRTQKKRKFNFLNPVINVKGKK